jgi:hypothetical protein
MRRYKQCILVLRETVTSFTQTAFIDNERHDEVRDALLVLTSAFQSPSDHGVVIRVDPALAFQSLSKDPILQQYGISLIIGNSKNVNKNPVAEKAIEELGLDCLSISPCQKSYWQKPLPV